MESLPPLFVADRFAELHAELVELLASLSEADWSRPTMCSRWSVRDVVAHLLDGDLRRLSVQRDAHFPPPPVAPIASSQDLTRYLDELNAQWVTAARRLSPRLLLQLVSDSGRQTAELFASLDPFAEAPFPVSWAGEDASRNWLDVAREYTEKWIHQQQIRDATGREILSAPRFLRPVFDAFVRALPATYRDVEAPDGTVVALEIRGPAGGDWSIRRQGAAWTLHGGRPATAAARVELDQDTAWRLFSTRRRKAELVQKVELEGDQVLGRQVTELVAVMA